MEAEKDQANRMQNQESQVEKSTRTNHRRQMNAM